MIVRSLADLPFLLVTGQRPDPDVVWPPPVDVRSSSRCRSARSAVDDAAALVRESSPRRWMTSRRAGHRRARRSRRRQPAVPRRAGRPGGDVPAGSELPGSLRALIAARSTSCRRRSGRSSTTPPCSAPADSIGALARFAEAMGQDVPSRRPRRAGRRRAARDRRQVVAVPQRRRARGRLPDADQAGPGPAPCRRRRGDGRAGDRPIDDVAHHAATAAELLAELGPVDGVRPTITGHAVDALLEAATAAVETGRYETAVRHASRALDLHHADRRTERRLLLVRSEAELERRNVVPHRPTPTTCSPGPWPTATARRRPRPAGAWARSPRCRATCRRPSASSGRRSSSSGTWATSAAWPTRCALGASPRCSAARWTTPARVPRRGDGDLPRDRRRARARLDAPEPGVGGLPGRRLRRRRGPADRGPGALRGARRPQRRELGRRPAGVGVVLPAPLRRGRGAGLSPSSSRPAAGATAGRR